MRAPYGLNILDTASHASAREHLFCNLAVHAGQRLKEVQSTAVYPKGAMLFIEGQQPRVFVLCTGKVKLSPRRAKAKPSLPRFPSRAAWLASTQSFPACPAKLPPR